ncbi:MAG: hypothetical protein IPL35_17585 [Sphingobacteriales bacterium]|nr:hypothetical protein [Sphingobacteriales bacterium]
MPWSFLTVLVAACSIFGRQQRQQRHRNHFALRQYPTTAKESAQISLFGGGSDQDIPEPKLPQVEEFGLIEKLNREKEVTGIYLSGHPCNAISAK